MNIICNNCVGGRVYEIKGMQYTNPFIWNLISPDDFFYLMINYKSINYKNAFIYIKDNNYYINIDKKIDILYPHHYKNSKYKKLTKITNKSVTNIYYYKMKDYLISRYFARVERMINEPPIFVLDDKYNKSYPTFNFTKEHYYLFDDFKIDYTFYFITSDKTFANDNINIIYKDSDYLFTKQIAEIFLKQTN